MTEPKRWYCPEHETYLTRPVCSLCTLARSTHRQRRRERRKGKHRRHSDE